MDDRVDLVPGRSLRRRALHVLVAVAITLGLAACGDGRGSASSSADRGQPAGTLRVLAAASLTEAFTELAEAFEEVHPDVEVELGFAASSTLAHQVLEGGPADVLATADEPTMARVVDEGGAAGPVVIARNRLAILVEAGNPQGVAGLEDLAAADLVVVLCAPQVPCGRFAAAALAAAGVAVEPASLEENVKAVAAKVTLGEADAGIVYATDVRAAGDAAAGVPIEGAEDPALAAAYPMALVEQVENRAAAEAWVAFVRGPAGQAILADHGFLPP